MSPLPNARHERFCQELAAGKSANEAYTIAGFKPNRANAGALRRKQHISTRVNELLNEREQIHRQATQKAIEATALTKEWVIATLRENVERAMEKKEVRNSDGQVVGYRYDGNVANRALELLGKELGMFVDRKVLTGKDGGPVQVAEATDADLARALAAFVAKTRVMQDNDGALVHPQSDGGSLQRN